jgi:pre-mRNA-processing factor 40
LAYALFGGLVLTFPTFLQYTDNLKTKEQEEREARLSKLRPAIRNMLRGNPSVHHYSTFPTVDKLFAQHPIWQQAKIEAERRLIFEEYVSELKQREMVRPCFFFLLRVLLDIIICNAKTL